MDTEKVQTFADIEQWKKSVAYKKIFSFITDVNDQLKDCTLLNIEENEISPILLKIVNVFDNHLMRWIKETPPTEQPTRFGNKAFRTWFNILKSESENLIKSIVSEDCEYIQELTSYFYNSFGNDTRIDYGTGHELSFVAFLCCLNELNFWEKDTLKYVGLFVFKRYLEVVRMLQTTYSMEPAGSQGVWGLDDFQFLPFYWGSAQMISADSATLKKIPDKLYCEQEAGNILFFAAVLYVLNTKTGPFFEHSPILFDISNAASWSKINNGLLRMYQDNVLHKIPIIQHFIFGKLLTMEKAG